jgi:hypothetical protein
MVSPQRKIVACLGSSSTAGKGQAFDWSQSSGGGRAMGNLSS